MSTHAWAQPSESHPTLAVRAGATCLDARILRGHLKRWLQDHPVPVDAHVEVIGDETRDRWLRFEVRREARVEVVRTFEPGPFACAQLHKVVALAIAVALRDLPPPPTRADSIDPLRRFELDASALLTTRLPPGLGGGAALGASLRTNSWFAARLSLSGMYGGDERVKDLAARYDIGIVALDLTGCLLWEAARRPLMRVCSGPALGVLLARGQDFARSRAARMRWSAWHARLELGIPVHARTSLTLGAQLQVALQRARLLVRDENEDVVASARLNAIGLAAVLGVRVRL